MKADDTVSNTGETLTMLVSEEDNGGVRQLYQVRLPPRRRSPPLHYHLRLTETFSVMEGRWFSIWTGNVNTFCCTHKRA